MQNQVSEILAKIEQMLIDIGLLNDFVHGHAQSTIELGGQDTPTLRKLVNDIEEKQIQAANIVIDNAKNTIEHYGENYIVKINVLAEGYVLNIRNYGHEEQEKIQTLGQKLRQDLILNGNAQVQQLDEATIIHLESLKQILVQTAAQAEAARVAANQAIDMTNVGPASTENFGFVKIGSGIEVSADGMISVSFPIVVATPSVIVPQIMGLGHSYEVQVASSTAVFGASIASFEVLFDEQPAFTVQAINDTANFSLSPQNSGTCRLAIMAKDTNDNISLTSLSSITKTQVALVAPKVLFPEYGENNLSLKPTILIQAAQTSGIKAEPLHTRVQIATDSIFTDVIFDNGLIQPYTTSIAIPELNHLTTYYVRASHEFAIYGWSEFGAEVKFITQNAGVQTPSIQSPLNNSINADLQPNIQLDSFASFNGQDTHLSTDIQLSLNPDFNPLNYEYSGAYLTSWQVPEELELLTYYYVRARHGGHKYGNSSWSEIIKFKSLNAYVLAPSMVYPAHEATDIAPKPQFILSPFANSGPPDAPASSQIQIASDLNFKNIILEYQGVYTTSYQFDRALSLNQDFYIRCRHGGQRFGNSDWSQIIKFTTVNAFIQAPTILNPAHNASNIILSPEITLSPFEVSGPADIPTATQIQIAQNADFKNIIHEYNGLYAINHIASNLPPGTACHVRARHCGLNWGLSKWSLAIKFTTQPAELGRPIITSPSNEAIDQRLNLSLITESAYVKNQQVTAKIVEIATDQHFINKIYSSGEQPYSTTTPLQNLILDKKYYARVAFKGSQTGWSAYSNTVSFSTIAVELNHEWLLTANQDFVVPATGRYKIEIAGAGGGSVGHSGCSTAGDMRGICVQGNNGGYAVLYDQLLEKNVRFTCIIGVGGNGATKIGYSTTDPFIGGRGGTSSFGELLSATGGGGGYAKDFQLTGNCQTYTDSPGTGIGGDANKTLSNELPGYGRSNGCYAYSNFAYGGYGGQGGIIKIIFIGA